VILAVMVLLLSGADAAETPARKPNIVMVLADDLGYADLGFQGCRDIPTPHLDALAAAGVRCTNGYVSGPYCSPTRAGLMSGRYQTRFGHEFNPSAADAGLPLAVTTLADRLQRAGYATGLVGKWHLGDQPQFHPLRRGFQEFYGFLEGAHDYFVSRGVYRGTEPADEREYLTDAFGREAVRFIDQHRAEPFFLYLAFNAVHTPMQADDARLAKFAGLAAPQRRTYAAMLSAMDDAVGRVRQKLREVAVEEDTLLFFCSDNGGPTMPGVTVNGSSNHPLRGSKRTTLEGGIRVPFVVSWPRRLQPGVYHNPVIQLDVTPTALAAAGMSVSPDEQFDGVDLLPFLRGEKPGVPHETLYWRFGEQTAIRRGDFKLVRYDRNADTLTGQANQGVTAARLYRLSADVGETRDLAAAMPEKVQELQAAWDEWNATLAPPLWGKGSAGRDPATKKRKKAAAK
jgi:arylsulfatase A-like enzyme